MFSMASRQLRPSRLGALPITRLKTLTATFLLLNSPATAYGIAPRFMSTNSGMDVDSKDPTARRAEVTEYYGKVLSKSADLKTNSCKTSGRGPPHVRAALANVHDDVASRYYGCGFVAPDLLEGLTVLDLGCGSGRDVYVLSQLVGEKGSVVGVDMTDEQLKPARDTAEWHRERFGYASANTQFHKGYIEKLGELGLADDSVDVIVSNCVINLSPDKAAVLKEAYRILKPGGELYFSDVYSSQRVPDHLREDSELWGECLSGALYWNDFLHLAKSCGFADPRLVEDAGITVDNAAMEEQLSGIDFYSATYRLWKVPGLEGDCEEYGQTVIYRGTMPEPLLLTAQGKGMVPKLKKEFALDGHHVFKAGKAHNVCGNTWRMLRQTRFAEHFTFVGDFSKHFGIFEGCGVQQPFSSGTKGGASSGGGSEGGCC